MGSQLTTKTQNVIIDIKVERPTYFMQDIIKGMVNIEMTEKQNHQGVVYLKVLSNKKLILSLKARSLPENIFLEINHKLKKNKELLSKTTLLTSNKYYITLESILLLINKANYLLDQYLFHSKFL